MEVEVYPPLSLYKEQYNKDLYNCVLVQGIWGLTPGITIAGSNRMHIAEQSKSELFIIMEVMGLNANVPHTKQALPTLPQITTQGSCVPPTAFSIHILKYFYGSLFCVSFYFSTVLNSTCQEI
jgi:hypothetical protein